MNRNYEEEVDVPVGPDNALEPGVFLDLDDEVDPLPDRALDEDLHVGEDLQRPEPRDRLMGLISRNRDRASHAEPGVCDDRAAFGAALAVVSLHRDAENGVGLGAGALLRI